MKKKAIFISSLLYGACFADPQTLVLPTSHIQDLLVAVKCDINGYVELNNVELDNNSVTNIDTSVDSIFKVNTKYYRDKCTLTFIQPNKRPGNIEIWASSANQGVGITSYSEDYPLYVPLKDYDKIYYKVIAIKPSSPASSVASQLTN